MKFKTDESERWQVSDEGYVVSKEIVQGKPVFTAWSPGKLNAIGYFKKATEARKCCEDHYKEVKNARKSKS